MSGQHRPITDGERVEDALDHLANLREEARTLAYAAGADASALFEEIDARLHDELSQPRPRTTVLATLARKLQDLKLSVELD